MWQGLARDGVGPAEAVPPNAQFIVKSDSNSFCYVSMRLGPRGKSNSERRGHAGKFLVEKQGGNRVKESMFAYCCSAPTAIPGRNGVASIGWRSALVMVLAISSGNPPCFSQVPRSVPAPAGMLPGLTYTNWRVADVPWSIHIVQWDRTNSGLYELDSAHAGGLALGLETLSEVLARITNTPARPVAALNGDFYQRDKVYAGAPRGLQIVHGELLSGPNGEPSFWIDALRQPHATNVVSRFHVIWPDGSATPFGLNADRPDNAIELYTPAIGASTHTRGGRELILERAEGSPWLPLRLGRQYLAKVREVREEGDTALTSDILVLSLGPRTLSRLPRLQTGSPLRLSTASVPALHGLRMAIGGYPILLRKGRPQKIRLSEAQSEAYEFSSMLERHPRAAIGWNAQSLFLVEVDGRQKHLSVGMTLEELATFLAKKLGCDEAMNLDGGGSATLWFAGKVQNSPCDRMEREIANALVILRKGR